MKKGLAFVLSFVLIFTVVALVACDSQPGGNHFSEVNLKNSETRTEFVNTLAEKADAKKLFGDPSKEGWSLGLQENSKSKLGLNLTLTPAEGDGKYTANGNVEVTQSFKAMFKRTSDNLDFKGSLSIGAKGNVGLSDNICELIGEETNALVKKLLANFNYRVDAYVDNDVALVSISDSIYGNLPESVTDALGSNKIKIALNSTNVATFAEELSALEDETDSVEAVINSIIDNFIVPYKISVSVAHFNGYAVKFTATKESILAILGATPSATASSVEDDTIAKFLSDDTKLELTFRVDRNGRFSSISMKSNFKLNLYLDIPDMGKITGSVSLSGTSELKNADVAITKPNEKDYTEFSGFEHSED